MLGAGPPQDPLQRLDWEAERVADRLRSLSAARLATALPPYDSRAAAGHAVAQHLADAAADLDGRPRIPVPRIGDHCVGDQVAVTAHDLLAAAADHPGPAATAALGDAVQVLRGLRVTL